MLRYVAESGIDLHLCLILVGRGDIHKMASFFVDKEFENVYLIVTFFSLF